MKLKLYHLFGMGALVLGAFHSCKLAPHLEEPALELPERLSNRQAPNDTTSVADWKWWEIYSDTTLQHLISRTLEYNKDLKVAAARVKELAALKRIDFANLFPQANANIYAEREGTNDGGNNYSGDKEFGAKAAVSWELDLWGNLRWAKDKSMAQFLGSVEAQRALQISLVATVAQSYFELVALDNELTIVRQTLNARKEGVRLAKLRFDGGLTSETSYQQAQVELARTATLVPELERKISIKENEISYLAGGYPCRIARSEQPEEIQLPATLPVGLPSTLLQRRPDVREAELNLMAAKANVGIAYTNLFPHITLTAQYGLESTEFSDFIKSPTHLLTAKLLTPLFAMGKNRAVLKSKKAAYEQECYRYEKSVLSAFKEARNAIVDFNKIEDIYASRLQLERSSKATMELAQLQYINGVIGYLDVLDAQRGYLDAQIGLSNAVRDKRLALVQLYKALGGGW
ncbi:RND efflux system, outer membrane lipoprotein, NodT family [gut metagenome]|uniref:RND efflux system, outer membrane lipoprotein, NodT family n=1 Tax=gut metagenome TaxID=749906 RepID=J9D6S1_9ZZZZ